MSNLSEKVKYRDKRAFNGGARSGAGRPIGLKRRWREAHMLEKIIVREFRHGQIRRVKKMRLQIVLDTLFKKVMAGDVRAIKKYTDLTLGKAVRPKPVSKYNNTMSVFIDPELIKKNGGTLKQTEEEMARIVAETKKQIELSRSEKQRGWRESEETRLAKLEKMPPTKVSNISEETFRRVRK